MAIKGYKVTDAVKERLRRARLLIRPKNKNSNALKPNDPKYGERKYRYRKEDPQYRKQARQKYYDKTKVVTERTKRRPTGVPHRPWTHAQDYLVLFSLSGDRHLGVILNRSVHAIQERRRKLKRIQNGLA